MNEFLDTHAAMVGRAVLALPLAALCGAVLAFRPRRRGTPERSPAVIQTQILLAIVSAVVMLIVGSRLATAFGIAGVASLIRYRAEIGNPKDAVVMLATLSVGLAAGVELYGLAAFATAFILAVLWVIESLEGEHRKTFELKVAADDPAALRDRIEAVLRRRKVTYELRSAAAKELIYETTLPLSARTDRVANAILRLEADGTIEVMWEEKKAKKK